MSSRDDSPSAQPSEDGRHSRHDQDDQQDQLPALLRAVRARKAEYIRPRTVRVKVGTWNVAAMAGTERDLAQWFVQGKEVPNRFNTSEHDAGSADSTTGGGSQNRPEDVGIYVLGLQEIIDVSSPSGALKPYTDPAPSNRWKAALERALPSGYLLISEVQLVGLLLLVYAAPNVAPTISSVSSTTVGTGLMGYMGNKGAVITRILLGETTRIVFINCHLAAGADKGSLDRRNWDAAQIISRAKFDALDPDVEGYDDSAETIGKEDFAFWFGDLNYRVDDVPGDDVRRLLSLHTRNEYDAKRKHRKRPEGDPPSPVLVAEEGSDETSGDDSNKSSDGGDEADADKIPEESDPTSLLNTLNTLLTHDQLRIQQQQRKAFHEGWREGSIRFLPTYKYDIGTIATFDSSEKKRGPSWCDRILYRSKRDLLNYQKRVKREEEARRRDEEMKARGVDKAADDEGVLFEYDPETDGANDEDEDAATAAADNTSAKSESSDDEDEDDRIQLTYYTSHQGILSSDHKPIDAEFIITYDAVIPELKATVYQDVVRQLDRAENEARPSLTVVIDHHHHDEEEDLRDTSYDRNAIYLGRVPYAVPVSREMIIANTGSVPATFNFASRLIGREQPEGATNPPAWLDVKVHWPMDEPAADKKDKENPIEKYTLLPGDSVTVEVTACVTHLDYVRPLNANEAKVEDILVLQVTGGRDHFIPIYGRWLPTCFGRSLEELTRMPETGARSLAGMSAEEIQQQAQQPRLSAPRELFRLTEAITSTVERAVAEWEMTRGGSDPSNSAEDKDNTPPWQTEPHGVCWPFSPETWMLRDEATRPALLAAVREALDTGERNIISVFPAEVPALHRLEVLAETLISFLRSLRDGIIPADIWRDMEAQMAARDRAKVPWSSPEELQAWVLDALAVSPVHSVSFTFVTFMLNQIANEVAPPTNPAALPASIGKPPNPSPTFPPPTSSEGPLASILAPIRRQHTEPSLPNSPRESQQQEQQQSHESTRSAGNDSRRAAVESTLSAFFSDLMISTSIPTPTKDKDRRAWEERKKMVIAAFLQPTSTPNTRDVTEEPPKPLPAP